MCKLPHLSPCARFGHGHTTGSCRSSGCQPRTPHSAWNVLRPRSGVGKGWRRVRERAKESLQRCIMGSGKQHYPIHVEPPAVACGRREVAPRPGHTPCRSSITWNSSPTPAQPIPTGDSCTPVRPSCGHIKRDRRGRANGAWPLDKRVSVDSSPQST